MTKTTYWKTGNIFNHNISYISELQRTSLKIAYSVQPMLSARFRIYQASDCIHVSMNQGRLKCSTPTSDVVFNNPYVSKHVTSNSGVMKYTDGSCVKNIQSVYHEQSLSDASFRLGASHVSTKEFVSNRARNYVTELAAHSAEMNDGEPMTHIRDTEELNSNMECNSLDDVDDVNTYLSNLRSKYPRHLVLTHLNINSIRYKFFEFYDILSGNGIDIVGISETKIVAYLLYHLYHAFLRVHILTCGYISVCVHIDGFAQNCGSSSANTLELPRSCIWPGMFSMYDLVCGCVGVILFIVFACFIYFIVGQ